jgi:hypothetical protein
MTNPTSNFGWQMPTSTDLVTDLPADFETFGQAVDTSLADLKGGTSGQVLSKASNTDMDFTWVTSDDANAIQNAIVDAKGDLIAASAADTPARLAVGSNGQALVANSSASTGLNWSSNAPLSGLQRIGSTTNLSGASTVTISGISNASRLWINIAGASTVNTSTYVGIRFNGDTGAVYGYSGLYTTNPSTTSPIRANGDNRYYIGKTSTSAADTFDYSVYVDDAFGAGICRLNGGGFFNGTLADTFTLTGGYYFATAQISSVSIVSSSGNFDAGTIEIWGA